MANEYNIISDEALDVLCGAIKGIANAGEILDDAGVAMDKTYSSFKIQEELDKKIEGDNVVKKDKIVTVLDDTVTDEDIPSAKVVVDELSLKANDSEVVKKTDIATTINSTSTDTQVPSAKSVYDFITNELNGEILTTGDIFKWAKDKKTNSNCFCESVVTNLPVQADGSVILNCIGGGIKTMLFISHSGVYSSHFNTVKWSDWQKVCVTTVKDVSKTTLTPVFPSEVVVDSGGVAINYIVRNGWCSVNFVFNIASATAFSWIDIATGLPKPANSVNILLMNEGGKINRPIAIKINSTGSVSSRIPVDYDTTDWWTGNISYPVAE